MDTIFHASEYQAVINRPNITDKPIPIYLNFTDPDDLSQLNKIVLFNDIDTLLVNPLDRVLSLFYKETVTGKVVPYYDNPDHLLEWLTRKRVRELGREILSCMFTDNRFMIESLGFSQLCTKESWSRFRISAHSFNENVIFQRLSHLMKYPKCHHGDNKIRHFKLYRQSFKRRKETISIDVYILLKTEDIFLQNRIYDITALREEYLLENEIPPYKSNEK